MYMILDYFDCENSSGLYFGDVLAVISEKLRLLEIKDGLKELPRKEGLGRN
jgi:hypothetical protein